MISDEGKARTGTATRAKGGELTAITILASTDDKKREDDDLEAGKEAEEEKFTLEKITISADLIGGDMTVAQVKSIDGVLWRNKNFPSIIKKNIQQGKGSIFLSFCERIMSDELLFFADHMMKLPSFVQIIYVKAIESQNTNKFTPVQSSDQLREIMKSILEKHVN